MARRYVVRKVRKSEAGTRPCFCSDLAMALMQRTLTGTAEPSDQVMRVRERILILVFPGAKRDGVNNHTHL